MPSPSSHIWGGLPNKDNVTIAHITDCPTIIAHAGKCYKAVIDSGAAISLLQVLQPTKKIEDCYKTPIQPTTAKLNTGRWLTYDGIRIYHTTSALGSTTLRLWIARV